jgi:hypothetical protein
VDRRSFLRGGGLIGALAGTYLAIKKAAEPEAKVVMMDGFGLNLDGSKPPQVEALTFMPGGAKWTMKLGEKTDGTPCLIYEMRDGRRGVIG